MENENTAVNNNLAFKLAAILGEIGAIEKKGKNEKQNYKYIREADVVAYLRHKLSESQIFVFHSVESEEFIESVGLSKVKTRHIFVCAESGETMEVFSFGYGKDQTNSGYIGDKGIYKAITGAVKYFWMKNFMLSDGNDPEHFSNESETGGSTDEPEAEQRASNRKPLEEIKKPETEPAPQVTEQVTGRPPANATNETVYVVAPEELRDGLVAYAKSKPNQSTTDMQRSVCESIEGLNGGSEDGRKIFIKYIFGKDSATALTVGECLALNAWGVRETAYDEYVAVLKMVSAKKPDQKEHEFIQGLKDDLGAEEIKGGERTFKPLMNTNKTYGKINNSGSRK